MKANIFVSLTPEELVVIREALVIARSKYEGQHKIYLDNALSISDHSSVIRASFIDSAFESWRQIERVNHILNDSLSYGRG